ncbi:hypothetical protein [Streptomyces caelestis]|uniref:hypothetical protein n=1 Tax=Streptomyces caelestis TaxID=36816 RepID=UPI0036F554D7
MSLFIEGPAGPEPLWLWRNEAGLPFRPASWEGVFRTANERCESVLAPVMSEPPFAGAARAGGAGGGLPSGARG